MPSTKRSNERWSMDFVSDSIVTSRRFRALANLDTFLGARRVVGVRERLADTRGLPEVITMDNGP